MKNMFENVTTNVSPMSKEAFAYMTIKEAILSGQLKEGESLVLTRIAKRLGISSIPLRSAIRQLISEGLVTQVPHYPPHVSKLSMDGLEEILYIRMYLELLATKEAIPNITPEILTEMEAQIKMMDKALEDKDMPSFGNLNKQFHLTFYDACPYPLLKQLIRDLWDNSDRCRSRTMFGIVPGLAASSQEDHYRLLGFIKDCDIDSAVELMKNHKNRSRKQFLEHLHSDDNDKSDSYGY